MDKSTRIRTWILGSLDAGKRFFAATWGALRKITEILFVCFVIFVITVLLFTRSQPIPQCPEGTVWFSTVSACIPGEKPIESRN